MNPDLDQLPVATIRTLAMDAVQTARSGHPGTRMALAPVAYVPWQRFLRHDREDPSWPDREVRHRRRIAKTRAIEARAARRQT